jgi:hypothetical protein
MRLALTDENFRNSARGCDVGSVQSCTLSYAATTVGIEIFLEPLRKTTVVLPQCRFFLDSALPIEKGFDSSLYLFLVLDR